MHNGQMTATHGKTGFPRKSDKWIPWYFVAFFVLLAIIDGIFVTIATKTHSGSVTEQAYQKGLQYNNTITAAQRQEKLGWQGAILFAGDRLQFSLKDHESQPLTGAEVTAYISRPTQSGYDFTINLEETVPGSYSAVADFPLKGQWDVRMAAQWQQQHYQQHRRIVVR